jgi:hypothetical protein
MRSFAICFAAAALWSGAALAQSAPVMTDPADNVKAPTETTKTFDGPSVSTTTTQHKIEPNGVQTLSTEKTDLHQSFSGGDGALKATTDSAASGETKTSVPLTVTKKKTTITNEETTR